MNKLLPQMKMINTDKKGKIIENNCFINPKIRVHL